MEYGYDLNGMRVQRYDAGGAWREGGAGEAGIPAIGVRFNDLFVLVSFSLILYFLATGAFVLVLAALFLLALFYSPSKEKQPDKREASL